tara:strand:- start:506 stop:898 length:393 start_codon:yes stop_codon:yes gene_type:complete
MGGGKITVFFDGACPLCRREIDFYRRRMGADSVCWVDVAGRVPADDRDVAPGLTAAQARARFHLLDENGTLHSGGDAFTRLWLSLPAFRPVARILQHRPFPAIMNVLYDIFLHLRPVLQRAVRLGGTRNR